MKIADRHPNFQNPEKPRPVIITGSEDPRPNGGGNQAFRHNIFNLTVSTGTGNPGATGIDYVANNRGAIRNVSIRSEDGQGVIGLDMSREWPGPALIKNVNIEGFNIGIRTDHHAQYSMTFQDITLKKQKKVGIQNSHNGIFFENLISDNTVPVLQQVGKEGGLSVIVGGRFTGGAGGPAIENSGGLVLRDIQVEGYSLTVDNQKPGEEKKLSETKVDEWVSEKTLGRSSGRQLKLPIKPSPEFVSENPADWQNAREFFVEGAADQTDAIQKALDSGKPVVYFPNGGYNISKALVVPPTVRKITGLQSAIGAQKDNFQGTTLLQIVGSGEPLIVEHLWFSKGAEKSQPSTEFKRVQQDSSRAVVFRHADLHGGYENTARGVGDTFFEDIMGVPLRIHHPQSVWGRQVNCEFLNDAPMIQRQGRHRLDSGLQDRRPTNHLQWRGR
ncbi:MAG: hypothetical protein HC904_05510 [Blastochloris sp.]|nr:hypothetical protein [Blastochloris sp.]